MFIAGSRPADDRGSMFRSCILPVVALGFAVAAAGPTSGYSQSPVSQSTVSQSPASQAVSGGYGGGACLSLSEGRRALEGSGSISLAVAVKAARASSPGEIVDYKICQAPSGYNYVLTILGANGKVARAWVDALSGKLISVK